jgi:hypothetical protein
MPKLILMTRSRYEFNPNSEILDPNLDQCCKGPWTNVTQTLKKHGVRSLGWFGRPCSHIMRTDDPTKSASMDCPSKTIHKGEPTACDLRYLDQPCSRSSMDTVDALVKYYSLFVLNNQQDHGSVHLELTVIDHMWILL